MASFHLLIRAAAFAALPVAAAAAPGPPALDFEARLTDAGGSPLDGHYLLGFRLLGLSGDELWSDSFYVRSRQGDVRAMLGRRRPIPASALAGGFRLEAAGPEGTGWRVRATRAPGRAPEAPAAASAAIETAPAPAAAPAAPPAPVAQAARPALAPAPGVYEVQPGDTLRSIALKLYGDPERWADLYQANDDRILRGGELVPGQRLIVPAGRELMRRVGTDD